MPSITLDGGEITLIGYNIKDSNYFKIRDIARLFDFSVGYEDGHISIDTSKPYVAGLPYDGGGVIGMAHEANLALFINEMPIVSYYAPIDTTYNTEQLERINENPLLNGVYVNVKEMDKYGFDTQVYEDVIQLTKNKDKKLGILDGEIINSEPTGISEVYSSDINVYLDGTQTRNIIINGEPYISAAELLKNGVNQRTEDSSSDTAAFERTNIDFERFEYERELAVSNPIEEKIGWQSDSPFKNIANFGSFKHSGDGDWFDGGIGEYDLLNGNLNNINEKYIGGVDILYMNEESSNDEGTEDHVIKNGRGIYVYLSRNSGGVGTAAQAYTQWWRGDFEKNRLVDGVEYYSGALVIPEGVIPGYRKEGAMVNGYHREFTYENGFRFGYRAVREGTIENGEYCGYYREYDENGKLIFEGDYTDYLKGKE